MNLAITKWIPENLESYNVNKEAFQSKITNRLLADRTEGVKDRHDLQDITFGSPLGSGKTRDPFVSSQIKIDLQGKRQICSCK